MIREPLPEFRLETYLARWEFAARHHLTASDAETLTVRELLALDADGAADRLLDLPLGYVPTTGGEDLRAAIAATYDGLSADDVLVFAGAQEALFWVLQLLLGPDDHAVVTVPNYQSLESVPLATGALVSALTLRARDTGHWELDLDELHGALTPQTRVVAVNVPNNPTGFVPPRDIFSALVELCDERGIRLVSDEVYRGLERDPARRLPQAAELSERALSVNVLSKAYGLPGLRIGWIAARDRDLLGRLERGKHYTSICSATPSEHLAAVALRHADQIMARNRGIIAENLPLFDSFFADHPDLFDWAPPDGGCVAFPRYRGADGVEEFCRRAVEEHGVVLLPASVYRSALAAVPTDRFRIGIGRRGADAALAALRGALPTG